MYTYIYICMSPSARAHAPSSASAARPAACASPRRFQGLVPANVPWKIWVLRVRAPCARQRRTRAAVQAPCQDARLPARAQQLLARETPLAEILTSQPISATEQNSNKTAQEILTSQPEKFWQISPSGRNSHMSAQSICTHTCIHVCSRNATGRNSHKSARCSLHYAKQPRSWHFEKIYLADWKGAAPRSLWSAISQQSARS